MSGRHFLVAGSWKSDKCIIDFRDSASLNVYIKWNLVYLYACFIAYICLSCALFCASYNIGLGQISYAGQYLSIYLVQVLKYLCICSIHTKQQQQPTSLAAFWKYSLNILDWTDQMLLRKKNNNYLVQKLDFTAPNFMTK